MRAHEVLDRCRFMISVVREEKAARESDTGEARLAHQKLADFYRRKFGIGHPDRGDG